MIAIETSHPASFREEDTRCVAGLLKNGFSINIVGLPKSGISCFVRFLAFNPKIIKNFFPNYRLVFLDINELEEINIKTLWSNLGRKLGIDVEKNDLSFELLCGQISNLGGKEEYPILIFLNRFDHLSTLFSFQFFANLKRLRDSAKQSVRFVMTTNRPISELYPQAVISATSHLVGNVYYLKPATLIDANLYLEEFEGIPQSLYPEIYSLAGGHQQITQIIASSYIKGLATGKDWRSLLLGDQRLKLQFDEIYEILSAGEKKMIGKLLGQKEIDIDENSYLLQSGLINKTDGKWKLFSPLMRQFIKEDEKEELSPQEQKLWDYLNQNKDNFCSKDDLIGNVWPGCEDVSDWALYKLIGRLKRKQEGKVAFKIINAKGRGYRLLS